MTDEQVVVVATRAKNGGKAERLLRGDWSGYGYEWQADLALLGALAPYTQDENQLERLWRASGLAGPRLRRVSYVRRTIAKAIAGRAFTYDPDFRGRQAER